MAVNISYKNIKVKHKSTKLQIKKYYNEKEQQENSFR